MSALDSSDGKDLTLAEFLVSDETARLDRVYDTIQSRQPKLATTLQRLSASSEFGMGRRMTDAGHAARMLGPERVRYVAMWQIMFDLMVSIGPEAVGEGICTAAASLAIYRSQQTEPNPAAEYQAGTAGFSARLGHWLLLADETDSVISGLLRELPHQKREPLQQHVLGRTATQVRREQIKKWNLGPTLKAACDPLSSSALGRLQLKAVQLVANPGPDAVTQEARRLATALGNCLNLGGEPWLPPSEPSPRAILHKIGALRDSVAKAEHKADDRERRINALEERLKGSDVQSSADFLNANDTAAWLDRELRRVKRHKRQLSVAAVTVDTRDNPQQVISAETIQALARKVGQISRTEDVVGMLDTRRLLVMLPETNLDSARIFAKRCMRGLEQAAETGELPPSLLYLTSVEKEGDSKAEVFSEKLIAALEKMAAQPGGPNFDYNKTSSLGWRS